ncbi:cyclic AMP-dependent transcription factor ATF-7 isoform X4 [Calonectris borealis]|uniref:cyclic AMP-dependent transcription factor ATF-7 isoform X4 n=1 Tax=Calonectris borealis TaxID=1323832 RepID=UPI003F4B4795
MGDDRPFVCNAPGCGQRFTNEDHLAVHKHKHEMTLKFGPARTDSVIIADQTPTPTRFLKNCEEVGLFNELASSFEHEFKKAAEDDEKKSAGALDMSLPSTPDIKIKEEEPVEVDSSPPDSPVSNPQTPQNKEKEITSKPVIISTPTPTIVRPGSLPLHLGYDPLHPTLPSPTSVITQAPPSNRQLGSPTGSLPLVVQLANGQTMPVLPGPPVQMPSVISLARPMSMVPNIPGIPGPPINSSGSISPSGLPVHSEAKMRLKASLTASSSLNGSNLVVGSASTMVTARPEQSQILVQHPDAPSPAQPQCRFSTNALKHRQAENFSNVLICLTRFPLPSPPPAPAGDGGARLTKTRTSVGSGSWSGTALLRPAAVRNASSGFLLWRRKPRSSRPRTSS